MSPTCSCGDARPHEIARRRTADDATVVLWSDGAVTGRLGYALPGVPIARPKTAEAIERSLRAGWMLADEVCLYEANEIAALYDACRWAAARGLGISAARARLADLSKARLTPAWEILRVDRDGRPTERVWRLPRLLWPGVVVWDYCTGTSGRKNGRASGGLNGCRYEIVYTDRDGVAVGAGLQFRTLSEVSDHLVEIRRS